MTEEAFALWFAGCFTAGCFAIHGLRKQAALLTPPLVIAVVCLGFFVALVAMTDQPEASKAPILRLSRSSATASTTMNAPTKLIPPR